MSDLLGLLLLAVLTLALLHRVERERRRARLAKSFEAWLRIVRPADSDWRAN